MKMLLKPMAAVGIVLAAASSVSAAAPAAAQTATVVKGVAIVDIDGAVQGTNAFKTAATQRETTYKPNLDQAGAIQAALRQQTDPLYAKLQADSSAANPDANAIKAQREAIGKIESQAEYDLNRALLPVADSQEYVEEQINKVLPAAIDAAAKKKGATLVLNLGSGSIVHAEQAYDLTPDVIAEINQTLPFANLTPPPNWVPRAIRERYTNAVMQKQALYGVDPNQQAAAAAAAGQQGAVTAPPAAPTQADGFERGVSTGSGQ